MTDQGNLFATPNRPDKLGITLQRSWTRGDDCWDLFAAVSGRKSEGPLWAVQQNLDGEYAGQACIAAVEALVVRFNGTLWDVQPRMADAEGWRAHWGG